MKKLLIIGGILVVSLVGFSADFLTDADMEQIETSYQLSEQNKFFRYILGKIKNNPSKAENIIRHANLWEKL